MNGQRPTRTPELDRLLARLGARLTRQVWMHGLGTALCATAAWLAFAFLADWWLHLPSGVRVVHLLVLCALPAAFLWRDLLRPLRRRPDRTGLAVLVERRHPELHELLVSAVQLDASERDAGLREAEPHAARRDTLARELVAGVLAGAERRAAALGLEGVLDTRRPRRRLVSGLALGGACLALLIVNADAASIFLRRIAGGSLAWPRRTTLAIEIPLVSETAQVESSDETIAVRVARGSDVPVLVRAEGVVPDEVVLHFSGGQRAVLASAGGGLFRTLLRSCQESVEFHATGGDDQDELPRVRLTVLQPPDVAGVAVRVTPPAYSGLPERLVFDSDVEVLAGSRLVVHVLPDPPEATGVARLLPDDVVAELAPAAYPRPAGADEAAAPPQGLSFALEPRASLRYRFELQDDSGLPNPDPGLFAVEVLEDRAPEIEIQSPGRGEQDTVLSGAIPLRVRAEDDFGLTRLAWSVATGEGASSAEEPLEFTRLLDADVTDAAPVRAEQRSIAVAARRLLKVADLAPPAADGQPAVALVEGQELELAVSALDNREPEPQLGRSAPVRIRIVTADEFLRRIQDRLARVQTSVAELGDLQLEKRRRTLDLIASLESDDLPESGEAVEIAALLTGQRRVLGDARALERELAAIAEAVLYARLDERAQPLLDFVDPLLAEQSGRGFRHEPWRALSDAYQAGTLGAAGLAGKLLEILGAGLDIGEQHCLDAAQAIERAHDGQDLAKVHEELLAASQAQARALERVEALLELLAEWDNFQSVLSLTRDILSRQKNLHERTRQYGKEN